jgi:hypothetical protein
MAAIKQQADTFFAFLDKHLNEVLIAVVAFILWMTIKRSKPSKDEVKAQEEEAARLGVNSRLIEPKKVQADAHGNIDPAAEKAYWVNMKAYRSATYATKLLSACRLSNGIWKLADIGGVDVNIIFDCANKMSIQRITVDQVRADYLSLQTDGVFIGKHDLLDDLKSKLGTDEFIRWMRQAGETPEQHYAL